MFGYTQKEVEHTQKCANATGWVDFQNPQIQTSSTRKSYQDLHA